MEGDVWSRDEGKGRVKNDLEGENAAADGSQAHERTNTSAVSPYNPEPLIPLAGNTVCAQF